MQTLNNKKHNKKNEFAKVSRQNFNIFMSTLLKNCESCSNWQWY